MVGNQSGDRVFLFLHTEICDVLFREMQARAFTSVRSSSDYGTVAVFERPKLSDEDLFSCDVSRDHPLSQIW
ncbi:MAG: hypothetical protein QOK38_724 [Acidobacteriaceae bacterium]|jgi:hypothetical protein|nr:hypothetical protein [Acidobacteriaceae bacterium]